MEKQAFVGRERELAQLNAYLDRALAGHGRVCFVVGEAGSGKTGLVPALYGLSTCHFVRAELRQVIGEGTQLLELAKRAGETGYELACKLVLGAAATHMGNLEEARNHLEAVVAQYDADRHGQLVHLLGHDPSVGALSYLSFVLWHQGYPEQALVAKERARAVADALDHPYSAGYAASFAAMLHQMLGQPGECQAEGERALAIGREGGYPMWVAIGALTTGWAMAPRGQSAAGIALLRDGLAGWTGSGARLALPYQRSLLADAYLAAGRRSEGLQAIISSFCCPDDVWWLPEQYRVRAELLLLAPGAEQEAEAYLHRAIEEARARGSKALELRAARSLAQLLRRQGRATKVRVALAGLLDAFTEGDALPDLRQARSLLAELAVG